VTEALKRKLELWTVLGPGWLLLVYLVYAQGISALDTAYWIVLPIISIWGVWGIWVLIQAE
jgi:hypothetical protein